MSRDSDTTVEAGTDDTGSAGAGAGLTSPSVAPLADGDVVAGRYRLGPLLGKGGVGRVHAAHDVELDRAVAVKLVAATAGGVAARARVRREAQAMARIEHDGVVRVHDVGELADTVYVVMEQVRGGTLAAWMRERRPWREVVDRFVAAARGLAAAHEVGVIHRDFKPANVLIDERGRPRVSDFGLAVLGGGGDSDRGAVGGSESARDAASGGSAEVSLTETGALVGTPAYMAPEQLAGEVADARSNQFSVCVALFEALHGARPFITAGAKPTFAELAASTMAGVITVASDPAVPAALDTIVRRGLSVHPAGRWPSMAALADALSAVSSDQSTAPVRRGARAGLVVAGAAVVMMAAAGGWWWSHRTTPSSPPRWRALGDPVVLRHLGMRDHDRTLVPLADGRAAFVTRTNTLEVGDVSGDGARTPLPLPDGFALRSVDEGSPGILHVAAEGRDDCAVLRVPVDGSAIATLVENPWCRRTVAVSRDERRHARADSGVVSLVDRESGRTLAAYAIDTPTARLMWNPSGTRLAVSFQDPGKGVEVLDATRDRRRVLPPARGLGWADDDTLVLVAAAEGASSLTEVALVGPFAVVAPAPLVRMSATAIESLHVGPRGVVLATRDSRSVIRWLAPGLEQVIDAQPGLDTRTAADIGTGSFGAERGIIFGRLGAETALIEVARSRPGQVVARHAGVVGWLTHTGTVTLYTVRSVDGPTQIWRWDAADRSDRLLREVPAETKIEAVCARRAERCLIALGDESRWIDPRTGALGDVAPAVWAHKSERLSPDGTTLAHIEDLDHPTDHTQELVLTRLSDGDAVAIPLRGPPGLLVGPVEWGLDDSWLLSHAASVGDPDVHDRVVRIGRDGTVTVLATTASVAVRLPEPAGDGGAIVMTHSRDLDVRSFAWVAR